MRKNSVYYIGYNDKVYSMDDIEDAFYLMTGKTPEYHKKEYLNFLDSCFGRSIQGYFDGTVENLIYHGCKIKAIKLYMDEKACGIHEAREVVEKMIENIKNNT